MADLPIEVYGINLLVRIVPDEDAAIQLRCPKGTAMRYAEVVSRGDGFDSDGNVFRAMPHIYAIVAFEEDRDEARGHSFTACRPQGGGYGPSRLLHPVTRICADL